MGDRMRRPRAAGVAVLAGLLVTTIASPYAAATQSQPNALTSAQIERALLTLSDLPPNAGFMAVPSNASGTPPASETGGICNGPNVYALAAKAKSSASGAANFINQNTDGPVDSEILFAFPSVAAAKQFVKAAKKQAEQCKTGWSASTGIDPADPPTQWSVELRPIAKVGDQRVAWRATGTGGPDDLTRDPDLPGVSDAAVVRVGNHVVVVYRSGISVVIGAGRSELEDLAKKSVGHLKQTLLLDKKSG
jgi:hypothetical protein